jgi:hypothetical protein
MNYFAHGLSYLNQPLFLAGAAVPDWLSVVDRRVRVTSKAASRHVNSQDAQLAIVAAGIMQHHKDDNWFHRTEAFARLSLEFTRQIRDLLPPDNSFRPSFLGHILVEILLDAALIADHPQQLDRYYEVLDALDASVVARAVNQMASRQTQLLEAFIPRFSAERFLYDYAEDGKLLKRLNRVMLRVGLPTLPDEFCEFLPGAREQVRRHQAALLDDKAADV